MKFKMKKGRVKILLLSCDKGISLKISALTSGSFDVESSNSAHAIIENKRYEAYRIIIVDLDNDPDGAYNVISFACGTNFVKNISFIAFTKDIDSDDARALVEINPDIILVSKPVSVSSIYNKIKELVQRKNKSYSPKIKKVKNTESLKLLKDSDTNLFSKQSFIEKLDLFIPTNKRRNMHLLVVGIDNLEIFSALFGDDKTNSLMTFLCSHLSSPIIMFSGRYSTDKIMLLVNGEQNTCEMILNELRIHLDDFKSKFPVILHGGVCEILPQEGEAAIYVNHALVAYIYAKYSDCDNVIKYENNMKFLIWDGKKSIYNTDMQDVKKQDKFDIDVPVFDDDDAITNEDTDDLTSDYGFLNKKENEEKDEPVNDTSFMYNDIDEDEKEQENIEKQNEKSIFDEYAFSYEEVGDIDSSINIDSPEDLIKTNTNDEPVNKEIEIIQLNNKDNLTTPFSYSDNSDDISTPNNETQNIETPIQLSFEALEDDNKEEIIEESNDNLSFGYNDLIDVSNTTFESNNENQEINDVKEGECVQANITTEQQESEIQTSNNEPSIQNTEDSIHLSETEKIDNANRSIFTDKDEFFKECNKILKKTENHNPLFMISTYSEFADDISYEDFELNTIFDVFGSNSYICKYDNFDYFVFFDEDFDEEKANTYAQNLIDRFTNTKYGNIIVKIGIGIASTISYDIKNSLFYAQFAYKNLKNDKETSSFKCFKSMNK